MKLRQALSLSDRLVLLIAYIATSNYVFKMNLSHEKMALLFTLASLPFVPGFYWFFYKTINLMINNRIGLPSASFEVDKMLYYKKRSSEFTPSKNSLTIAAVMFILVIIHIVLIVFSLTKFKFYYFIEIVPAFVGYRYLINYFKFHFYL